ncbi:MAG: hypothetical protein K2X27_17230 [Candidatus Obscuribacterales bacterium]|nr:hypothetical protein [Candidatus Obscuribacterales bacterium]
MRSRCSALLALVFVLAFLSSCSLNNGDSASHNNSGSAPAKANPGSGPILKLESGANAKYPSEIPFPQYPGSEISQFLETGDKEHGASKSITLKTSDAPGKTIAFYKNWFSSNGWKLKMETATSGMSSISAESGDRLASIFSMPGAPPQANSIQIVWSSAR